MMDFINALATVAVAMPRELSLAVLGGLLPSLLWLGFWLMEDRCEPEPKLRLILTFLAGIIAVWPVYYVEKWVAGSTMTLTLGVLVLWAAIEEIFKFIAAAAFGLTSRAYDEPVDAVIYLVTAALGFAAAENALFLWTPISHDHLVQGVLNGDMRFVGATLLHTLTCATIGLSMAFSYYRDQQTKSLYLVGGVILAVVLHTLFNFFILKRDDAVEVSVFLSIWAGIVGILFLIERIKHPARDYC